MTCRTLVYAAFRPSSRLASSKKSLDRAFARARSKSSFPESDDFGSKPRKPSQYKSVGVDGAYPTYIARAYFKNPPKFLEDEEDEIYHPPSWEDIYDRHLARRREELEELESAASIKEQVGSSQVAKEESSDTGEETTSGDVPVGSKSAALSKEQIDSSQLAANEETTSGDEPVDSKSAALTKDQIVSSQLAANEETISGSEPVDSKSAALSKDQIDSSQLAAEESSDANEETTSGYEPNSKSPAEAYRDNVHKHRLLHLEVPQFTDEVPAWFEANDFERFIVPLYQRGWQLQFEKNLSVDIVSLVLKDRVFTFRSWKQAMVFTEFATDIANIQNVGIHVLAPRFTVIFI
ncbi:hypothetical protein J132_06640 [Termitomyces sp. J132]|nr:hypothetical protein J132_06640 [Termitomyces sp. J132]